MSTCNIDAYRRQITPHCRFLTPAEEMQAWLAGDLQTLVKSQLPWVLHLAARFAARYRFLDMDALLSAGNLAVTQCVRSFDPRKARLTTYAARKIFWAMRSEVRDAQKGVSATQGVRQRNNLHPTALYGDTPPQVEGRQDEPLARLIQTEQAELLRAALDRLPERYAQILRWRFLDGLRLTDVGQRLGVTKECVRQQQKRALARLREILGPEAAQWQ